MRGRALVLACATSLFGLACDAPTARPDTKSAEREAEQPDEPTVAPAGEPIRDLAELERELSGNEARLRQLGVPILATAADGEFAAGGVEEEDAPATELGKAESKSADGQGRQAASKDRADEKTSPTPKKTKQANATTGAAAGGVAPGGSPSPAPVRPDPDATLAEGDARDDAKSIQNPPADRPTEQTEEERCPLICSLADSTCELTDEICELADRHTDDDAYSLACERASNDCKLAREACLECLG